VVDNAMRLFDLDRSEIRRMLAVFGQCRHRHRYSCMPGEWYLEPHGWVERTGCSSSTPSPFWPKPPVAASPWRAAARRHRRGRRGLHHRRGDPSLTPWSSTGSAARDVRRLPIFGLGCAGASSA